MCNLIIKKELLPKIITYLTSINPRRGKEKQLWNFQKKKNQNKENLHYNLVMYLSRKRI
jgi:hypothetical protein